MKHKTSLLIAFLFFLGCGSLQAQNDVVSSGGDATGSGGSSSYSIGQVLYTVNSAATGSEAQGVQQPYEISVIDGINHFKLELDLSAFPNPTSNYLTLTVGDSDALSSGQTHKLSYQLFDLSGKLLDSNQINQTSTTIKMEALPTSTYFLKVKSEDQLVRTFKIIKS